MNFSLPSRLLLLVMVCSASACRERQDFRFTSSHAVNALNVLVQQDLRNILQKHVGSFQKPVLLGGTEEQQRRLSHGQQVYKLRCVQCHGVSGDGEGSAGATMYPSPRDYRKGIFKFTSVPYGLKPLREDLTHTIRNGVHGTSMPEFKLLPNDDIESVLDYVLFLTRRGELEEQLAVLADAEEKVTEELVAEEGLTNVVTQRWQASLGKQTVPLTSQPVFTEEHVRRGQAAFLSKGCSKCHGEDGRGQTPDNLAGNLKDAWGHATRAADLTSGMLHGGTRPIDIYRRIYNGINGTPMPGFGAALQSEPDTLWDLVAYVQYVSGRRRAGVTPEPGSIAPFVTLETAQAK